MSSVWLAATLGELCDIYQPKTITAKQMVNDGPYLVYGANGVIGRHDSFNHADEELVMGCRGSVGALHFSKPQSWITGNAMVIRPKVSGVDRRFVFYALQGSVDLSSTISGSSQPQITRKSLAPTKIPIPPLPEQQRIVGILDQAFEGIAKAKANAERNLMNAKELFESELESIFGELEETGTSYRLGDLGKIQTGSTPKTSDPSNFGEDIPFVKPADFNTDGTLDYEKDGLSIKGAEQSRTIPPNSALMVCIGATIGKCGFSDRRVTCNQQINAVTPTDGVNHIFLYYQMTTKRFQKAVISNSGQATLPIINKSKWSDLRMFLPNERSQQAEIVTYLDSIREKSEQLSQTIQSKVQSFEDLKASLLHQAFSGNL